MATAAGCGSSNNVSSTASFLERLHVIDVGLWSGNGRSSQETVPGSGGWTARWRCPGLGRTSRLRQRAAAALCHFNHARAAALSAIGHITEVAAYRDSHHSFYDRLYVGGVADARIRTALRTLKQNLSLLLSGLVARARLVPVQEVMEASFQAFLLVLLAGGNYRSFTREDHDMIEEEFRSLKRAFCMRGEGLVTKTVVESKAETAEGVVTLMGQTAERLVEELSIAPTCDSPQMAPVSAARATLCHFDRKKSRLGWYLSAPLEESDFLRDTYGDTDLRNAGAASTAAAAGGGAGGYDDAWFCAVARTSRRSRRQEDAAATAAKGKAA